LARRHISRVRGKGSFRRTPGQRKPREISLIVCEGESEQMYFRSVSQQFGLTNAEVVIPGNAGSAPISVVDHAIERANEQGGYDHIFCVFDRDGHESFHRARQKLRGVAGRSKRPLPIQEIVSVPCFEVWVLMHFIQSDASFNECSGVIERIRDNYLPDYEKADLEIIKILLTRMDTAVTNAVWLAGRPELADENPSTAVHKLVQHLKNIIEAG
jgi:hypothetical protein